jgi:hypothetical protein
MQHLGPLVIISMVLVSGLLVMRRHNGDTSLTISKHAALEGYSALSFGIFEIVVALLFFLFIKNWFTPQLGLPYAYTVMAGISLMGLAVAGAFPDRPGRNRTIHGIGAYTMATGMYLSVLGLTVFGTFPAWLTGLTWLATIYMSIGIICLLVAYKRFENKLLYYQSAYMGTFYLVMILATYFHS